MYRTVSNEVSGQLDPKRTWRVLHIVFDSYSLKMDEDTQRDMLFSIAWNTLNESKWLPDPSPARIDAILIYAYSTPEAEKHGSFDIGRIVATRDGKGWLGDGIVIPGQTHKQDLPNTIWYQRNVHFILTPFPFENAK